MSLISPGRRMDSVAMGPGPVTREYQRGAELVKVVTIGGGGQDRPQGGGVGGSASIGKGRGGEQRQRSTVNGERELPHGRRSQFPGLVPLTVDRSPLSSFSPRSSPPPAENVAPPPPPPPPSPRPRSPRGAEPGNPSNRGVRVPGQKKPAQPRHGRRAVARV